MSSPCLRPDARGLAAAVAAAVLLAGCNPQQQAAQYVPVAQQSVTPVVISELLPGGTPPPPEDPRGKIYEGDPYHIAQGQRYFIWYNCNGCHFLGGGGIGPPFMSPRAWRYGGRIDQIYNSIKQGRPNGMPYWGDKISDSQIWEIAAFVRSLSSPTVKSLNPPQAAPPMAPADPDPNHPQQGETIAAPGPPPEQTAAAIGPSVR